MKTERSFHGILKFLYNQGKLWDFIGRCPMKTYPCTRMFGLLAAAALASCASPPESTRMPVSATIRPDTAVSAPGRHDSSASGRLFDSVNSYRRSQGAMEVQRHAGLDRLAQEHCEYLRRNRGTFSLYGKNVSHFGFDGRAMAARERFQMSSVSENVAAANYPGNNSAAVIVELWKNSRDHNKNMTDDWTHSGIGVVVDSDGMVFATQIFATKNYSQMALRDRMNSF
jgi:uncharacterized protein YkwD